MFMTLKETVKIRTICRRCRNVVNVIQWTGSTTEYICSQCGYSIIDSDKIEKVKNEKDN